MRVLPLLAAAALVFAGAAAAQQYYKWKDSSGTWHYTTTPPPAGAQIEKVSVDSSAAALAPAPSETPAGTAADTDAAPADASAPGSLAQQRSKFCEESRTRVAALESSPVVRMDSDGDGTAELLSATQHDAELQHARELARFYCSRAQ